jgi:hypothetical protein
MYLTDKWYDFRTFAIDARINLIESHYKQNVKEKMNKKERHQQNAAPTRQPARHPTGKRDKSKAGTRYTIQ